MTDIAKANAELMQARRNQPKVRQPERANVRLLKFANFQRLPWSPAPISQGTLDRLAELDELDREEVAAADLFLALARANVGGKEADFALGPDFRPTPASKALERALRASKRIIVLDGDPGSGKSVLATHYLAIRIREGRRCSWIDAQDLDHAEGWREEKWRALIGFDFLVVDDAWMEDSKRSSLIRKIIWHFDSHRPRELLLTTMLGRSGFDARYGGVACHRRTCGGCNQDGCNGSPDAAWISMERVR